jgi:serine protease
VTLRRGARYAFYTVAVDHAGNRERAPKRPDAHVTRR